MQLFNQGKRKIITRVGDLMPQCIIAVDDEHGKKLLELFPNELKALEVKKEVKEETKKAKK